MDSEFERPIPQKFPAGTKFYDAEGAPFVMLPGGVWFNAYGGSMRRRPHLTMEGYEIDEAEFRQLVQESMS